MDTARGSCLTHVRVTLQVHGQGETLSRIDNHTVSFQTPAGTTSTRTAESRKLYFDHCFDAATSAEDLYAGADIATLAACAVQGYSSGVFVAGLGRNFAHSRAGVFEPLVASLEELLAANPTLSVSYAHIAVTDTKCVDLVQDKPVDLAASGGSLRALYQPVGEVRDLVDKVRQGCSLPYMLWIRFENADATDRTEGHLLLADMGLPCFDPAISLEKLQKRGPGLSLSIRTLRTIVTMLTTAGAEGPVPYHLSHFTNLCKDFFGGNGTAVFVLHVDASNDASNEELAGFMEFAEPLRKLQILERATVVDPRLTETELVSADWAQAHKEITAELEQTRSVMATELEAAQARLVAAEEKYTQDLEARTKEYAHSLQEKEVALRQEHTNQEAIWRADLQKVKSEMERALEASQSERETAVAALTVEHAAQIDLIASKSSAQLAENEREQAEREALFRMDLTKALNDKVEADERARCLRVQALHAEHDRHALMMERDDLETSLTAAKMRCEELQTLLATNAAVLIETQNALKDLKSSFAEEQAAKVAAEALAEAASDALTECREQISQLQTRLDAADTIAGTHAQQIEHQSRLLAEGEAALAAKTQRISACEADLEEARGAAEAIRAERDAAIAQTEAFQTVARGEAQALREEISLARAAAEHAETELEKARADATSAEKVHGNEMMELRKLMADVKDAADQRAREWERNEGRFEGEREGWNRQQMAWDRERERLLEDMQELKLEIARARVSGAGEEDKMKLWFAKIESENRALRDEVAEVKNLRRQRRDSDFESVRLQTRADRLEAENARLAEEAARREAEWTREKTMLARESELRERELKAAAAKALRDEQLAAARRAAAEEERQAELNVALPPQNRIKAKSAQKDVHEDVLEHPERVSTAQAKARAGNRSRGKKANEPSVVSMELDENQPTDPSTETSPTSHVSANQSSKRAKGAAISEEPVTSTDVEPAADLEPVPKRRRQTKAAVAVPDIQSRTNPEPVETAPLAHLQAEQANEDCVAPKKPAKRKAAQKLAAVEVEEEAELAKPDEDDTAEPNEDVIDEENNAQRSRRRRNNAGGQREYWVVGAAAAAAAEPEEAEDEAPAEVITAPVRKPRATRKKAVAVEDSVNDTPAIDFAAPAATISAENADAGPTKKSRKSRKKLVEAEADSDPVDANDDAPAVSEAEEPVEEVAPTQRKPRASRRKRVEAETGVSDAVEAEVEAPAVSDSDEIVTAVAPAKRKPRAPRKKIAEAEPVLDDAVGADGEANAAPGEEEAAKETALPQPRPRASRKKAAEVERSADSSLEAEAQAPFTGADELVNESAPAETKARKSRKQAAQIDPVPEETAEPDDDMPLLTGAEPPVNEVAPAQKKPRRSRKKDAEADTTAENVNESAEATTAPSDSRTKDSASKPAVEQDIEPPSEPQPGPSHDSPTEREENGTQSTKAAASRRKPARKTKVAHALDEPASDPITDQDTIEPVTASHQPTAAKGRGRGKTAAAAAISEPTSPTTDVAPTTKAAPRKRKKPATSASAASDTGASGADAVSASQRPPDDGAGAENVDPAPATQADKQKRRKLNGGRRTSLEMVEHPDALGDDDSLVTAAAARRSTSKHPSADPTHDASSLASSAATLPPATEAGDASSGSTSSSQKLPQLPNLNASGRMQFKKRPGLDPERMAAILKGYGFS
ncbi:hypothetical protein HDU86_000483 [Geranomyces michiganensis]|nr:hypothetical protein HDU86_000483 [Geranomyces michiganensis]